MVCKKNFQKLEEEVSKKISEYDSLSHRLKRYWKKLVNESLYIAKERQLITAMTNKDTRSDCDIVIKRYGDEIIDDSQLLDLSKKLYPSLHRKYLDGNRRLERCKNELREFRDKLNEY